MAHELYLRLSGISVRFKRLSERFGNAVAPPKGAVNFFGDNFMRYLPYQQMGKSLADLLD